MTVRMCPLAVGFRTKWSVGHPIDMHREVAGRQFRVHVAAHTRRVAGSGDLFRAARRMGLEGLVSKRKDRPDQAGRSFGSKSRTGSTRRWSGCLMICANRASMGLRA